MYGEILGSGLNAKSQRRRDAAGSTTKTPRCGADRAPQMSLISQTRKRMDPDIGCRQATDTGCRDGWPFDKLRVKKGARRAVSGGTIVLFFRKMYRLLQDIPCSIRLFQLGGFVGEDKRVTPDMRVEVVKNSPRLVIGGWENPVLTRISPLATRLNPLKAMQVVDFPDIEENKAFAEEGIS